MSTDVCYIYCCFSKDTTQYLYHLECSLEIHYTKTFHVIILQTILQLCHYRLQYCSLFEWRRAFNKLWLSFDKKAKSDLSLTKTFVFFCCFFNSVSLPDSIRGPLERQARAQTAMLCRSPNKNCLVLHISLGWMLTFFLQACAPRYVYFSINKRRREPVGTCFTASDSFSKFSEYSPCRTGKKASN